MSSSFTASNRAHDGESTYDLRGLGARNLGFSVSALKDLRDRADIFSAVYVVWQTTEYPKRARSCATLVLLDLRLAILDPL